MISPSKPACKWPMIYLLDFTVAITTSPSSPNTLSTVQITTMMRSPNKSIFRVTCHLCGEFTGHREFPTQRPVTRNFDVFFDLHPNKRLCKQSCGWWFETPSWSLWRHCNVRLRHHSSLISTAVLSVVPDEFWNTIQRWQRDNNRGPVSI